VYVNLRARCTSSATIGIRLLRLLMRCVVNCYHVMTKVDSSCLRRRRRRLTVSTRYAYGRIGQICSRYFIIFFFLVHNDIILLYIIMTSHKLRTYDLRLISALRRLQSRFWWQTMRAYLSHHSFCMSYSWYRYTIHLLNRRPYYYYIILMTRARPLGLL